MQRFYDKVLDQFGNPAAGVSVSVVKASDGSVPTLYLASDNALTATHTIPNPFTTDASGVVAFAAANDRYTISYSGSNITPKTLSWVTINDSSSPSTGAAPYDQTYLVLNNNAAIPNARLLTFSARFTTTDAGVGSTYSVDLNAANVTAYLNTFTTSLQGLAPASGGGTTNYLRADGSWAAPPGTYAGVTRNAWSTNADYTISGTTDQYIEITGTWTAPRNLNLPAASGRAGQTIYLKDAAGTISATNTITTNRAGADTLVPGSGITNFVCYTPGTEFVLISDGTSKWTLVRLSRQRLQFTSGGSWVAPPGLYVAFAIVVGGGGGGGGNGATSGGPGGGAGEVVYRSVAVVPGTSYTITIAAAANGAAQSGSPTNGIDGNSSSFGSLVVANGGRAGQGGTGVYSGPGLQLYGPPAVTFYTLAGFGSAIPSVGNAPATPVPWWGNSTGSNGTGGTVSQPGCAGGTGYGGPGGNGGNGGGINAGTDAAANTGAGGGGGGTNGTTCGAGGKGGSGLVIVEWSV